MQPDHRPDRQLALADPALHHAHEVVVQLVYENGDQQVEGLATARVVVGKRNGQQSQDQRGNRQGHPPGEFGTGIRRIGQPQHAARHRLGARVDCRTDVLVDLDLVLAELDDFPVGGTGFAFIASSIGEIEIALAVGLGPDNAFTGKHQTGLAVFDAADKQVGCRTGFAGIVLDKVDLAAVTGLLEHPRRHGADFILLAQDVGVFAALARGPRPEEQADRGNQQRQRHGKGQHGPDPAVG